MNKIEKKNKIENGVENEMTSKQRKKFNYIL